MDVYLSSASNRTNEVIQRLTLIATIFLPLTFVTGFFGQNFGWLVENVTAPGRSSSSASSSSSWSWRRCSSGFAGGAGSDPAMPGPFRPGEARAARDSARGAIGAHATSGAARAIRVRSRVSGEGGPVRRRQENARHDLIQATMRRLWAPWRLEYIQTADDQPGCVFCARRRRRRGRLVVHRGEHAFVLLNKFPYASGHLMVAPLRHTGELGALDDEEALEVHRLAPPALDALARTMRPQGFNLGWNLGRVAGAGVVDHVHLHVVPRWAGDTNFMPVLADVKVMPEALEATRAKLAAAWHARPPA